jgi:hypothetical protein
MLYCDVQIVDFCVLFFLNSKLYGWLYVVEFVKCLFNVLFWSYKYVICISVICDYF